jgi:hypothetical protein
LWVLLAHVFSWLFSWFKVQVFIISSYTIRTVNCELQPQNQTPKKEKNKQKPPNQYQKRPKQALKIN